MTIIDYITTYIIIIINYNPIYIQLYYDLITFADHIPISIILYHDLITIIVYISGFFKSVVWVFGCSGHCFPVFM